MRKFFVIWASQAVSLLGSALVQFAIAWYLTRTTGSASVLATAMLIGMLPQVILGPFVGPFIDRWNRKRIMITADLAIAAVTAVLVVLYMRNAVEVWHVYVAMLLRSLGGAFHFPAMQASIPLIVPEKHLARAAGLSQMLNGLINALAPTLGAVFLGFMPIHSVLAIDIGTALIAVSALAMVAIPQPESVPGKVKRTPLQDMGDGLKFVWSWKGLVILLVSASLLNLFFTPTFALMPILVTKHFGGGVMELGWLESAMGVGLIVGGLAIGIWGGFKRRIVTSFIGILLASASILAVGLTSSSGLFLGVGLVGVGGAALSMANAPMMAIFQSVVPKDMQGRVFSIILALATAASPLGLAVAGVVADASGVLSWYFIAGGAGLALGVAGFFIPTLMQIESRKAAAPEASDVPAPSPAVVTGKLPETEG